MIHFLRIHPKIVQWFLGYLKGAMMLKVTVCLAMIVAVLAKSGSNCDHWTQNLESVKASILVSGTQLAHAESMVNMCTKFESEISRINGGYIVISLIVLVALAVSIFVCIGCVEQDHYVHMFEEKTVRRFDEALKREAIINTKLNDLEKALMSKRE